MVNSIKTKKIKIGLKLSKLNFELSKAEALMCAKTSFDIELLECFDNICTVLIKTKKTKDIFSWLNKLAFTKEAYFISHKNSWKKNFLSHSKLFNLKIGKYSCFKIHNKTCNPNKVKEVAKKIVESELSRKVCVSNPDLSFFVFENHLGLKIWESKENFESRRSHLKSAPHPTALNPRVARAMINLASAKNEVLDPFCGSGGILEEAKIIGLSYYGVDISEEMIRRAEINLKSPRGLFFMNAFSWSEPVECIVTDIPYGKSSFLQEEIESLVKKVFEHFNSLTHKIVMCSPSNIDVETISKKRGWKKLFSFEIYVHKSLTRKIHVLERKK